MKDIKHALQQRLAQKNLSQLSIGAFLVHQVKQKSKAPDDLTGFIRRNVFTIKLPPQDDKTAWFISRIELKDELNEALRDFGYEYVVKDIRFW